MSDLLVVTVTFNSERVIERFVGRLNAAAEAAGLAVDLVIVDNGSSDLTLALVERLVEKSMVLEVALLRSQRNLGYGAGINLGVNYRAASGDLARRLLVINPDVMLEPEQVRLLLETFDTASFAALGARVVSPEGRRLSDARDFPSSRSIAAGVATAAPIQEGPPVPVDWISGGLMIWATDIFLELRGFDESYFLFFEDVDLCMRAWSEGHRIGFASDVVVVHEQGDSHQNGAVAAAANRRSRRRYARSHLGVAGVVAAALADLRDRIRSLRVGSRAT